MRLFKRTTLDELITILLEKERSMLLSGDASGLAKLISEKEKIFMRLESEEIDSHQAERIRRLAKRNQLLLNSFAEGIQEASERLKKIEEVRNELRTYTQDGKNKTLANSKPNVTRRA